MKITHIDSTYVPIFIKLNGRKQVKEWVSPEEFERVWFDQQMIKRFGKDWQRKQKAALETL